MIALPSPDQTEELLNALQSLRHALATTAESGHSRRIEDRIERLTRVLERIRLAPRPQSGKTPPIPRQLLLRLHEELGACHITLQRTRYSNRRALEALFGDRMRPLSPLPPERSLF